MSYLDDWGARYDAAQQPHEPVPICEVCLGTVFVQTPMPDRYGFDVTLNECPCGFVFLGPRMTVAVYTDFYQHHYRGQVAKLAKRNPAMSGLERSQKLYAAGLGDWLGDHLLAGPLETLLDVGGSTGVVAEHFVKRFGIKEAWVLDPSPEELRLAEQRGLKTLAGFIETVPALPPALDLILVCQTIDHMLHPRHAFDRLHRALRTGGWLFVDILIWRKDSKALKTIKVDHPLYWSSVVTRRFLADRGFEIVEEIVDATRRHRKFLCRTSSLP